MILEKIECTFIIVNFNGGVLLTDCVKACLASSISLLVLVSDNGSNDGSVSFLKRQIQDDRLKIILNNKNFGFSAGVNRILSFAKGKFVLFLNPDCMVKPHTVENIIRELEKKTDAGMASCLILNPDGTEQAGCRRRVPTPARSFVRVLGLDTFMPVLKEKGILLHENPLPDDVEEAEAISGAFMLVRREALEDVGVLDEDYFLHCEDLDWCMRFRRRGWKILFIPHESVTHKQGTCSHSRPIRVEWHKHKGMVRFYRKFFRHQYPFLLMAGVIVSVWLRFIVVSLVLTGKRLFRTHIRRA
ncbi:MAG: dTDP-Rha--alpha-D-GlcNAc-pyrophosphate polyprenol alpha-3-L-rhamnosyltransferase [Zetaproteobacteria bacterium CG_4_9_14_3_um_filter_49_83]|nr:MAG: dTDP-Rha--alpha-D-GlcNAc-pyrophosphate polyprenol alpha-3-L-rhamnosyltransferase [Zetaproteobacteria bacterium CG1_02_49_23]PIQ33878.1 MAG: dTDP-Rha--alpha-D-GlcNAc-pyrophosphate polyprenol alpha-3-L-rhamnosyltransferase [Zetaproteobacteria bacterium CG17_big_fil_post_rev_8_21_14_2_50_50_13]PIV30675.1 MAG: dTDP-Rha--alpha-D-GlcNAc-pyrophosphate polyprenol alpha-3-L-rhamnosyltransferase [Zetaproteobacteria bacterium CG02_land_8_20_14_3_00_50_9]PIY55787.1 MAG: dTDP-Rha--alpha-D-GlcNAc-pyro